MPNQDISLARNAGNGKFEFSWNAYHDVAFDTTVEHQVLSCLLEQREMWWADENGVHGSRLYQLRSITGATQSNVDAYCREALQELVDAGTIEVVKVTPGVDRLHGRAIAWVTWRSLATGQEQSTKVSL